MRDRTRIDWQYLLLVPQEDQLNHLSPTKCLLHTQKHFPGISSGRKHYKILHNKESPWQYHKTHSSWLPEQSCALFQSPLSYTTRIIAMLIWGLFLCYCFTDLSIDFCTMFWDYFIFKSILIFGRSSPLPWFSSFSIFFFVVVKIVMIWSRCLQKFLPQRIIYDQKQIDHTYISLKNRASLCHQGQV